MKISEQIANNLYQVYFGGNWTDSNFKSHLQDITWQMATQKVQNFNTIAALTFHSGYYVNAILEVLQNKPLNAKDEFSFDVPPITKQTDWDLFVNTLFTQVETLINLIKVLPNEMLNQNFTEEKYGNYYRNLHGLIEHSHYHLGQIVIIKKLIKTS